MVRFRSRCVLVVSSLVAGTAVAIGLGASSILGQEGTCRAAIDEQAMLTDPPGRVVLAETEEIMHTEGKPNRSAPAKSVDIEFLFLDRNVCTRCRGTDANLETAVGLLTPVLAQTGVRLNVRSILIESEEQADRLGFVSSPTIRVGGRDIAGELRESLCESCGEVCGADTDCRVWIYRGREHTEAPVGLIVDAILGAIYAEEVLSGAKPIVQGEVPENLKRFFASKGQKDKAEESSCCSPPEKASSCAPSEETASREEQGSRSCGCK